MKKLLAFFLSLVMLFSLTACEKEDVDLALDIALSVLEELERYENAQSDALPEYTGEGAESVEEIPEFSDVAYVAVNGKWTVACQAFLSTGFPRPKYWTGLPFPPPGDLPDPGIKPESPAAPALQVDSLQLSHLEDQGKRFCIPIPH